MTRVSVRLNKRNAKHAYVKIWGIVTRVSEEGQAVQLHRT